MHEASFSFFFEKFRFVQQTEFAIFAQQTEFAIFAVQTPFAIFAVQKCLWMEK